MNPPEAAPADQLVATLTGGIMALSARQQEAITQNGWVVLEDFRGCSYKDLSSWIERMDKRPQNRGGCTFGNIVSLKLQALSFWINQMILHGNDINIDEILL